MEYHIKIKDKIYIVSGEIQPDGSLPVQIKINKKLVNVDIANPENFKNVIVNGISYQVDIAEVSEDGFPSVIEVDGDLISMNIWDPERVYLGDIEDEKTKGQSNINSPLAGQITSIEINEGDIVKEGDTLCTLVAMKMENEIKSTLTGKVSKVSIKVNDIVNPGDPLFIIKAH